MNTSRVLNLVLAVCLVVVLVTKQKGNVIMDTWYTDNLAIEQKEKTLFDETYIGRMKLKNRFVRASVGDHTEDGKVTDKIIDRYVALAAGGVGTILTGYTLVDEAEKETNILAMYNDEFIDGGRQLVEAAHRNGSNILMQLVSLGSSIYPKSDTHPVVLGVSPVKNLQSGIVPKEMTVEDIHRIQSQFADAAVRAQKAGFDGIEIHACHGYLLHQFAAPYYNRRTDHYGGNRENRYRMTIETYEAIRQAVGKDFQVWIKIQSQDGFEEGVTHEDCLYICEELAKRGMDAIEISGNFMDFRGNTTFFRDIAAQVAERISVPVIVTGGNREYEEMEKND
ncbi:MAG: NADH:flavin oxidoreductase [Tannerellaceae bacterium]|nr:NADH:flavin oxidoreductase [Tannerellaceae bacterium]